MKINHVTVFDVNILNKSLLPINTRYRFSISSIMEEISSQMYSTDPSAGASSLSSYEGVSGVCQGLSRNLDAGMSHLRNIGQNSATDVYSARGLPAEANAPNFGSVEEAPTISQDSKCCQICGRFFPRSADLRRHMIVHTNDRPFPCHYCEYRARQPGALVRHVRNKHSNQLLNNAI